MTAAAMAFALVGGILLLALPRHLAAIPLLICALYVPRDAVMVLGPADFTVTRLLVAVGFVRIVLRGEHLADGLNGVDKLLLAWAAALLISGAFHSSGGLVYRSGILWTELGSYFLFRIFVRDLEDALRLCRALCIALVPIALLMILEKHSAQNFFEVLGTHGWVDIRLGNTRSRGPFAHAILAGTVGAACVPLALYLWRSARAPAAAGLAAAAGIVYASTSSAPILMSGMGIVGVLLWPWRAHIRTMRMMVLLALIGLDLVMKDPVYFLVARIDLAGGSQGWFRARLIQSSIEHLNEWWLIGTDYTRHWMSTGVPANANHTDITNHFLALGVMGGLPLMALFFLVLRAAFRLVGGVLDERSDVLPQQAQLAWVLGAALFSYVATFFSISLFDQSIMVFYMILALIGAVRSAADRPEWACTARPAWRARASAYSGRAALNRDGPQAPQRRSLRHPRSGTHT